MFESVLAKSGGRISHFCTVCTKPFQCNTNPSVRVRLCACMCALRSNWPVGTGQPGEDMSRRSREIATLHQFCSSGAQTPEAQRQLCSTAAVSLQSRFCKAAHMLYEGNLS